MNSEGSAHPAGSFDPNTPTQGAPGHHTPTDAATSSDPGLATGGRVGPYRLLTLLGEGGFGMVWLAERREPIVQRVALKVIKPGMDSRAVIARFEQERQALAVMDHPNVARVFDAGTTDAPSGSRPYFVMEYVKGEPITRFCDRMRLTVRQRLELFIPVCEAVQHAHHKGLIHRDLKPGNMLVVPTEPGDGSQTSGSRALGVPKVIDFGISKAISHLLTDKTIYTEQGQVLGTPEYMSPEQADLGAVDVDTRADVYSLGVVLYELLAGLLPFGPEEIRGRGFSEVQRLIRETPAPRPSTRLATPGSGSRAIAESRRATPEELRATLRTELEWIPLRALRKDRADRYSTPADLAQDIRNYLEGRPLTAGPESGLYRFRKFVRRRRVPVLAGSLIFLALIGGTIGTSIGMRWALRERTEARLAADREREAAAKAHQSEISAEASRAEAERRRQQADRTVAFLTRILSGADPEVARGREITVREVLDDAAARVDVELMDQPEVALEVHSVIAGAYANLRQYRLAERHLERALILVRETGRSGSLQEADLLDSLARVTFDVHQTTMRRAAELLAGALEIRRKVLGESDPLTVRTSADLGQLLGNLGDEAAHERMFIAALRIIPEHRAKTDAQLLAELDQWVKDVEAAASSGDHARAVQIIIDAEQPFLAIPVIGNNVPSALNALGAVIARRGAARHAPAAFADAAIAISLDRFGADSPRHADTLRDAFFIHGLYGSPARAAEVGASALALEERLSGPGTPTARSLRARTGRMLALSGRAAEGQAMVRQAMQGADNLSQRDIVAMRADLAFCHSALGQHTEAEREAVAAIAYFEAVREFEAVVPLCTLLAASTRALGRESDAAAWEARAESFSAR